MTPNGKLKEVQMPLGTRSKPRQIVYLTLAFAGLILLLSSLAHWRF